MATEKLQPNQVYTTGATSGHVLTYNGTAAVFSAPTGGKQETQFIATSGGSADKTTAAFAFIPGIVVIEFLQGNTSNSNAVYSTMVVNVRSYSGTKTNAVTGRTGRGPGNNGFLQASVTKSAGATPTITIGSLSAGADTLLDGTGIASFTSYNWHATGGLRVTAIEDTQA